MIWTIKATACLILIFISGSIRFIFCILWVNGWEVIFIHELTHYKHNDILWRRLASILIGIHCFNPIVWKFQKLLRKWSEHACDFAAYESADKAMEPDNAAGLRLDADRFLYLWMNKEKELIEGLS